MGTRWKKKAELSSPYESEDEEEDFVLFANLINYVSLEREKR